MSCDERNVSTGRMDTSPAPPPIPSGEPCWIFRLLVCKNCRKWTVSSYLLLSGLFLKLIISCFFTPDLKGISCGSVGGGGVLQEVSAKQIFKFLSLGVCQRPSEDEQKKSDGVDGAITPEGSRRSTQVGEPEPDRSTPQPAGDAARKSSASARRALFARRRLDASSSPGGSPAPSITPASLHKPPSPPCSPSPGPLRSSTPPSPLSLSTSRPVSPFPGLSPVVPALMPEPPVPPGPPGDAASRGRACLHGAGAASTRLVSPSSA